MRKIIQLHKIGDLDLFILENLKENLENSFKTLDISVEIIDDDIPLTDFKQNLNRRKYNASLILKELTKRNKLKQNFCILGVLDKDIFYKNSNYVFGLARVPSQRKSFPSFSLISVSRLFYGHSTDRANFKFRILKEAIHMIGLSLGLKKCNNSCVMQKSTKVNDIDKKPSYFCDICAYKLSKLIPSRLRLQDIKDKDMFHNFKSDCIINSKDLEIFNYIASISSHIRLDRLRNMLGFDIETFIYKILKWVNIFGLEIDKNFLRFEKDDILKVIDNLDHVFKVWEKTEKNHEDKSQNKNKYQISSSFNDISFIENDNPLKKMTINNENMFDDEQFLLLNQLASIGDKDARDLLLKGEVKNKIEINTISSLEEEDNESYYSMPLSKENFFSMPLQIKHQYSNREIHLFHFFYKMAGIYPKDVVLINEYVFFIVKSEDYFRAKRLIKSVRIKLVNYNVQIIKAEKSLKMLFNLFPNLSIHDINVKRNPIKKKTQIIFDFLSYQDRGISKILNKKYLEIVCEFFKEYFGKGDIIFKVRNLE